MEYDIIYCPDCELFYMSGLNQKTKEQEYTYVESDTAAEIVAKKLADNIYQCADCGTVFEIDRKSPVTNTKSILGRPRGANLERLDKKVFLDEFVLAFKTEPTEKQLNDFMAYMMGKSNDVSSFIDIVINAKNGLEQSQMQ